VQQSITIDFTAENQYTNDNSTFYNKLSNFPTIAQPFIDIMDEAAAVDPTFK
jgi:hypothetical protein